MNHSKQRRRQERAARFGIPSQVQPESNGKRAERAQRTGREWDSTSPPPNERPGEPETRGTDRAQ